MWLKEVQTPQFQDVLLFFKAEAGYRQLIGAFLVNAVDIARKKFNRDDIALFSEVDVKHFNLPGVGPIQGSLDYLTSKFIPIIRPLLPSLIFYAQKQRERLLWKAILRSHSCLLSYLRLII